MKVVCLYGSGGEFKRHHLNRFCRMVRGHAPAGTMISCVTDDPEVINLVDHVQLLTAEELKWGWERSWQKLAMLKIPGPCLYLDLDVNVVGDLSPMLELAAGRELVMSLDFWNMFPPHVNASVIGWRGDLSRLYRKFAADPKAGMTPTAGCTWRWGDGQWLLTNAGIKIDRWQWLLPGSVRSYKNEVLLGADTKGMAVCVSHGEPRPWGKGGADEWFAK